MRVIIIRHSITPGNLLNHYDGRTDEPLHPKGVEVAERAHDAHIAAGNDLDAVDLVFVTSKARTQETARIMFPNAEQVVIPELREMDFGDFEGRSAAEMSDDPAYREWVDGMCMGRCPGGESTPEFDERVRAGFAKALARLAEEGAETAYFVVHGGTIMSLTSAKDAPAGDYFSHLAKNCEGYEAEVVLTGDDKNPFVLENLDLWRA